MSIDSQGKYIFKYTGDVEYIRLETLINSQLHFLKTFQEVKNAFLPDAELDVYVKPQPKGSVVIELLLKLIDVSSSNNMFPAIIHVKDIVGGLVDILNLVKFLDGEKPKCVVENDDNIIVHNDNGSVVVNKYVYNSYVNNPLVTEFLSKGFEFIENAEKVDGIEIFDGDKNRLIRVERKDFAKCTQSDKISEDKGRNDVERQCVLSVVRPSFLEGYKWDFIYNSKKISAYVKDESFYERVVNGDLSFSSGDKLVVDLEITKVYDEGADEYIDKGFKVIKVTRHKPRPKLDQDTLFDG